MFAANGLQNAVMAWKNVNRTAPALRFGPKRTRRISDRARSPPGEQVFNLANVETDLFALGSRRIHETDSLTQRIMLMSTAPNSSSRSGSRAAVLGRLHQRLRP